MRVFLIMTLGISSLASLTTPSFAQTYRVGSQVDDIVLDSGKEAEVSTFPEVQVKSQSKQLTGFFSTLFTQRFASQAPILVPDLPSPYNSSVRNQGGYYRVTSTEPILDSEILR